MLRDKVVLITGAARGIGRYNAKLFAAAGARVAVADMRNLDLVSDELRAQGATPLAVEANIRDEVAVQAMMERVAGHFGRIDVLLNNAGIPTHTMPHRPFVRDTDLSLWEQIIDTNLGGTFLCTKHALPYMEKEQAGHIINVYGGGRPGSGGAAVYVASKDAVRTFTRFVAEEEREHGICIVAMGPGGQIATETDPEEVRRTVPGLDTIGNRFLLAAEAPMEMSGRLLTMKDGQLAVEG
jgi:3-oxoacyl-[acyl-carrier protein] reductase